MIGATMGCFVEACTGDTMPNEDWLIFDTPIGSFEILLCDEHYAAYAFNGFDPVPERMSPLRALELIMDHPVKHGAGSVTS